MKVEDCTIDPDRMWPSTSDQWRPLGFVDLGRWPHDLLPDCLPPFPLIGLGSSVHPLAGRLDAIVESPISAQAVIRHTILAPNAAAVGVQLLRSIEGLPAEQAVALESFSYGLLQGSAEHAHWLAARVVGQQPPAGRVGMERCDSTLRLVLDRPLARNAIDRAMRDQLFEAFSIAALDSDLQSVMLRAVGPVFCVGGELAEFGTTRDPATAHLIRSRTAPAMALAARPEIFSVRVQGACIGAGLELAAFARRLTATSDAWFQLPELAMGLIPGAGGCFSVMQRIGRQRATLMLLSGRRISATTALRWGLIDAIEQGSHQV